MEVLVYRLAQCGSLLLVAEKNVNVAVKLNMLMTSCRGLASANSKTSTQLLAHPTPILGDGGRK